MFSLYCLVILRCYLGIREYLTEDTYALNVQTYSIQTPLHGCGEKVMTEWAANTRVHPTPYVVFSKQDLDCKHSNRVFAKWAQR